MLITGVYQSLFLIIEWFPKYGRGETDAPKDLARICSLWNVNYWKQTALIAPLFQLYLALFAEGLMITTVLLTGKQTAPFSDNPLFAATSPSDFWGRRWNLTIHECLKGGVYKPIRKVGGSKVMAVIGTFAASGLFHEWLLPSVFGDFNYTHGLTLMFFLWQALLVGGEAMWGEYFSGIAKILPRPLRTLLVIMLGIPAGIWFTDCYWRSNFFVHAQLSIPMVRPV